MSAARSVTVATQNEALKTLQLEMIALQELIHRDYAEKLAAIDQKLERGQISKCVEALNDEMQIRLNFLTRCEEMAKYNEMMMTNGRLRRYDFKLSSPHLHLYMFKNSRPSLTALQTEIELLTTTIRITKRLMSDPTSLDSTLKELADHAVKLDAHLNNEQLAGKKKKMWADIIFAIGGLLTIALIVLIPMLIPVAVTLAGVLAFVTLSILAPLATLGGTLTLSEAIRPSTYCAESNVEICKQAPAFAKR